MHSFPEWFMITMVVLTNPVFWVVILILLLILIAYVVRKIKRKWFSKKSQNA